MNSNQRSQGNSQSSNGGNEKDVSSSRGGTVEKNNMNPAGIQSEQSGTLNGSTQAGTPRQGGSQQGSTVDQSSTDRTGSKTGGGNEQQGQPGQRQSNDLAGGLPKSPGTSNLSADRDMDDDTGLSNRANNTLIDEGSKQMAQSNVGRRSDMTPD